jgi:hypothetical protein
MSLSLSLVIWHTVFTSLSYVFDQDISHNNFVSFFPNVILVTFKIVVFLLPLITSSYEFILFRLYNSILPLHFTTRHNALPIILSLPSSNFSLSNNNSRNLLYFFTSPLIETLVLPSAYNMKLHTLAYKN